MVWHVLFIIKLQKEKIVYSHITDAECGDTGTVRQLKESKCTSQVSQMFGF